MSLLAPEAPDIPWLVAASLTLYMTFSPVSVLFLSILRTLSLDLESESHSVMSDSLQPHGLYSPWNSPGQNTGVGCHSLLQGSSQPRDGTQVSRVAGGFCTN